MSKKEYYAHSGISKYGIAPQKYYDHIKPVLNNVTTSCNILIPILQIAIKIAALFHDIGKLDPLCQKILSLDDKAEDVKMLNHVDAGVAYCLKVFSKTKNIVFLLAAYFIHSHHRGFENKDDLFKVEFEGLIGKYKINYRNFRCNRKVKIYCKRLNGTVTTYVNKKLQSLLKIHKSIFKNEIDKLLGEAEKFKGLGVNVSSTEMRMALSLLVDADHENTSYHYKMPIRPPNKIDARKRIDILDDFIESKIKLAIKNGVDKKIIEKRTLLYKLSSDADLNKKVYSNSGTVGSGKTLSNLKLSLLKCEHNNLERIFVIEPFTSIIDQVVDEYRNAISFNSERKGTVVNAIHSMCEYENWFWRKYSHLWNCPINVSTSVQLFESLITSKTGRMRKLKQFANSVIVLDEYQTMMKHDHWNVILQILKELVEKFNVHLIFSSGTPITYWKFEQFAKSFDDSEIFRVIPHDILKKKFVSHETRRVKHKELKRKFASEDSFYSYIDKNHITSGKLKRSTCIVFNTVRNAQTVFRRLKKKYKNINAYHLSSRIAPVDRVKILDKIKKDLKQHKKILLVSTSVIECGIDFSFEIGFREFGLFTSIIQFSGRINRNGEYENSEVIEFSFDDSFVKNSDDFSSHPGLKNGIDVRRRLNAPVSPDWCSQIISEELISSNKTGQNFVKQEQKMEFKDLNHDFNVIDKNTVPVLVYKNIADDIRNGKFVPGSIINSHSVNLYITTIEKVTDNIVVYKPNDDKEYRWEGPNIDELYLWSGPYDKDYYGLEI